MNVLERCLSTFQNGEPFGTFSTSLHALKRIGNVRGLEFGVWGVGLESGVQWKVSVKGLDPAAEAEEPLKSL